MSDGATGSSIAPPERRVPRWLVAIPPLTAVALLLIATRRAPLLSPDSITYLSAAAHVHDGRGLIDFTLKPLTVFGPIYPLLLAPGGRSLAWARVVGAAGIAACTVLMWLVLRHRVRPVVAVAGALALGASHGLVRISSIVWSETPYAAISLATIAVLCRQKVTPRVAAAAGALAGIGFLTRYAGAGLVATAAAMVLVASRRESRVEAARRIMAFAAPCFGAVAIWAIRNVVEVGQPLGPRFEGGVREPITSTFHLAFAGIGRVVIGDSWSITAWAWLGATLTIAVTVVGVWLIARERALVDIGMALYAATSLLVPIVARRITSNDIELRVMSPMLLPLVYFAVVAFDRLVGRRTIPLAIAGTAVLAWWCYQGTAFAARFTDLAPAGSGYRAQYAPQLYDEIDALPADAVVLTNNPQRVWWFTGREPTLMGFTRPRAGNSHFPIDAAQTLRQACSGHAYLAWFIGLQNAGGGPDERRPDLAAIVELRRLVAVPGGQLYSLVPRDPAAC